MDCHLLASFHRPLAHQQSKTARKPDKPESDQMNQSPEHARGRVLPLYYFITFSLPLPPAPL